MTDPQTLHQWDHEHVWHPFTQATEWEAAGEPLIVERAEGCNLHGSYARLGLPAPLAGRGALRVFPWGEDGAALCLLTCAGQCFRLVLGRSHKDTAVLSTLQSSGRLDLRRYPFSASHCVFDGQEAWDVAPSCAPCFWVDR